MKILKVINIGCILFTAIFNIPLFAEAVYKQVDSQGRVIFSDTPGPGKKEVDVNNPNVPVPKEQPVQTQNPEITVEVPQGSAVTVTPTAPTQKPIPNANVKSTVQSTKVPITYTISILSPTNDETFQNATQNLPIELSVSPTLEPEDKIVILVDGKEVLTSDSTEGIELPWLERGPHSVQAKIRQKDGPGASSNIVNFFQQRTSTILQTNPAGNPPLPPQPPTPPRPPQPPRPVVN